MTAIAMPRYEAVPLTGALASVLLRHWLGKDAACRSVQPLEGGICSAVFRLEFDEPPYCAVVKLRNRCQGNPFRRERERIEYLHQSTNVPCPRVYLHDDSGTVIPYPFLLLECLPGTNLRSAWLSPEQRVSVEQELADVLLDLHSHKADTFHGVGQEPGARRWIDVFLPSLEENRRDMAELLSPAILLKIDAALPFAEDALGDQGDPTLIHNDVWAGNIIVHERHDGWHLSGLVDPVGLQYAEVEKELAYLQAFDTVGEAFFRVYEQRRPLRPGYERRKLFYWLNMFMIHVWLGFGTAFHDRIAATCDQIMAGCPASARGEPSAQE